MAAEFRYSKWRKLDNAALAYPAVSEKNHTRVFRFYCQLTEPVDGELLQKALDQTIEKYPLFQAVLRKGLFWYYLEHRDLKPVVQEEKKPPCSKLYIPDKKSLLFEVSYYKNRINFEVFHALTDGTGAMHFLQELTQDYLILAHPEKELPRLEIDEKITAKDREEDSFSQYYSSDMSKEKEKKLTAARLSGEKLSHFYLPVHCSGGNLRHGQLHGGENLKLVLVCRSRVLMCLADRGCGLQKTKEYPEK